jgi:asparagine synthetase B (glutamine-hydrolysing)
MNESFFHVRRAAGAFEYKGQANCALGRKIQNPARMDVDGIFVEWAWDGSCLRVHNDRYGLYPIYYFANENEIAISNSIGQLLEAGACRDLDYEGLATFLYFGSFIGEDTPFRAIRALPPNATLEWRDGRLTVSGQITIRKEQATSRDDAIDAYISLFRAAIARRPPGKPMAVALLSGGRDSRHITLELCGQGLRPDFCLTADYYPGEGMGNEIRPASLVCQAMGLKHAVIRQTKPRITAELRKNRIAGFTTGICEHAWMLAVRDYLARQSCTVYIGIGGDVLSAGHYLSEKRLEWCEKRDYRALGRDLLSSMNERLVEKLFGREMARRLNWEAAYGRFEREFLRHVDAPDPIGSFHFWNKSRRHAALCHYALLGAKHDVCSPYLDNDLFDFLASLPPALLIDRTFHTETIHRAFPSVSHVPWIGPKTEDKEQGRRHRSFALDTLIYLYKKGRGSWTRRSFVTTRLIRCLVDTNYSPQAHWIGATAVYLAQLEEATCREIASFSGSPDFWRAAEEEAFAAGGAVS